ncbi:MAG: transglutaminase-like domain-containing protein [Firmicutes bacterium]|nr:transglutaminase-like domain-containing protein [Bacillota bacterium]
MYKQKAKLIVCLGTIILLTITQLTLKATPAFASAPVTADKPAALPQKAEPLVGINVKSNAKASVDASNLQEGYITVKYLGGRNVKIKLQITKQGGTTYNYNLNNAGNAENFPLSEGNGKYSVGIFENVSGNSYTQAYSCDLDMVLRNVFLPFLYPNQYVNYKAGSPVAQKATELTKDMSKEMDKLATIYHFVVNNLSYDSEQAATVTSGYLPDVDKVLERKKGICFDYAALMCSMLRLQNIPCKLVIGFAGTVYHAWINVYITDIGWIDKVIYFDGKDWSLMDPTFVSSARGSQQVMQYVSDGKNYNQKFVY